MGAPRVSQVLHGFPLRALLFAAGSRSWSSSCFHLEGSWALTEGPCRLYLRVSSDGFLSTPVLLEVESARRSSFRAAVQGDIALAVALHMYAPGFYYANSAYRFTMYEGSRSRTSFTGSVALRRPRRCSSHTNVYAHLLTGVHDDREGTGCFFKLSAV